ncbi:MAG: hypothetical protein RJB66_1679 [Pseudomonadota bacterium]|jgi:PST family polysaccharide transporter
MKHKQLAINVIALFILQITNYIIPLVSLPYLVRVLGSETFGTMSIVQSAISYFLILVDYGFYLTATREVAIRRDDLSGLRQYVGSVYFAKMVFVAACGVLLFGSYFAVPFVHDHAELFLAGFVAVIAQSLQPQWIFLGLEQGFKTSGFQITSRIVATVLIFPLVQSPEDVNIAMWLNCLGWGLSCGMGLWAAKPYIQLVRPQFTVIKKIVKDGWYVFLANLSANFFNNTGTLLVGFMLDRSSAGYFSLATRITTALVTLQTPLTMAVFPKVQRAFKDEITANALKNLQKYLAVMVMIGITMGVGTLVTSPYIIPFVFGKGQANAVPLIQVLAFLPLFAGLNGVFGSQVLLSRGHQYSYCNSYILAAIFNAFVIYAFVAQWAVTGAALALIATEIFLSMLLFSRLRTHKIFVLGPAIRAS